MKRETLLKYSAQPMSIVRHHLDVRRWPSEITLDCTRSVAHRRPVKTPERRRFERWETSIPCAVEWEGSSTTGRIANLSFGGALIKQVEVTPPKGTRATIRFEVQKQKIKLSGSLEAKILRTVEEFKEEGKGMVWLGVRFEGPEEEIKSKLTPVFKTLFPDQDQ